MLDKNDQYKENKSKVFVIIKGQCSLTMKNRIEAMKGCKKIEEEDDVIESLKWLKDLSFAMADMKHECWMMNESLRKVMTARQQEKESLVAFH